MSGEAPEEEAEELPEALQLHAALAIACLALELIADESFPAKAAAVQTIRLLRRDHPVAREHLTPAPGDQS